MKNLLFILITFIFACNSNGQSNDNQNIDNREYRIKEDSIFYMKEMSHYLDTTFLNRYESDILKYERTDSLNGYKKGQVLFLGSSTIRKWTSLKKDMYPIPVINRGFGGSTMSEAIYYFNRIVIPYEPSSIVLYEGDNDITASFLNLDVVLSTFKLFVRLTEKYIPNTHIYFISIKPSPSREKYIDKLLIANMYIEDYCNEKSNLHYIDITHDMYDDMGEIRRDIFTRDELHMNEKGYSIWAKIIKDALLKQ
ncbi:MAG: hypothetical protein K8R54_19900 [Bacteroidales bacterium]|nr:hypothetical protein [Bacteroidales bacterium]